MENHQMNPQRRSFLKQTAMISGVSVLSGHLLTQPQAAHAQTLSQTVRVVIAGSGLGGLAVATRLRKQLPNAKITVIDGKQEHNYQPGYTLVATGIWSADKVSDRNERLMPQGVEWIREPIAEFAPDANKVTTASGQTLEYDYLVVATGVRLGYDKLEGMDVNAIGQNGLASVYHSPVAAANTWQAMDAFRQKGGRAVMTLAKTPMKCAGAPLKMTFMVSDRLRESGRSQDATIDFYTPIQSIFSVKVVNDHVLARWEKLPTPVATHFEQELVGVDIGARQAHFKDSGGNIRKESYDFLHVVPPMYAPDSVKNSPLVIAEGQPNAGWLEVDKGTLQHKRYPNIFGIGDINGTARGKTAATVKKSAPIVVHNLLQTIQGKAADQLFDGYTSCPLLTREGSALLIEFDYDGTLTPSLPLIEPLQDSYLAWLLKYALLKPAYMAVLKGRV